MLIHFILIRKVVDSKKEINLLYIRPATTAKSPIDRRYQA
jgi:hypothetical protein